MPQPTPVGTLLVRVATPMSIVFHDELPFHEVPRIKTRVLAGPDSGANGTAVWEQLIEPGGFIPLHYHEVEEVLVFLAGKISLTLSNATTELLAPATVVIPARQIHGLRPSGSMVVHLLAFFPTATPKIIATDGTLRPLPWQDREDGDAPP